MKEMNAGQTVPGENENNPKTSGRKAIKPLADSVPEAPQLRPWQLYATALSGRIEPNPIPAIATIEGAKVIVRGAITVVSGKAKSGKTALVNTILGGFLSTEQRPGLGFVCEPPPPGRSVVYLDTESALQFPERVMASLGAAGLDRHTVPPSYRPLDCCLATPAERWEVLESAVADFKPWVVVLDGLTDLMGSVNDEKETIATVDRLIRLASERQTAIVAVVHENQKTTSGNGVRGWIGSQLERKACAVLTMHKGDSVPEFELTISNVRYSASPAKLGWHWSPNGLEYAGPVEEKPTPGRAANYTEAQRKEVLRLHHEGHSIRKIEAGTGIPGTTIRRIVNAAKTSKNSSETDSDANAPF